ncbi:MAG TPA: thioredoxin family protein, partial [Chitinophagaceae bacterium]|nr:thioredoxin family protein [Chitinophagaceae bacterium]
ELSALVQNIAAPQTWLVLTEGWCGDAAQIIPVLHKLAALNSNIALKFLLRDENLELMDMYLTKGISRSIPKLIVLDENNDELFNFGPRPGALQEIFYHLKANAVPNAVIKEEIHKWYAKDKTITTQLEILELLKGRL